MASEELKSIENYILSENKEEALRNFPVGSYQRLYLEGNTHLAADPFSQRLTDILKLLERNPELYNKLQLRIWLRQYDINGDQNLLSALNKRYFGYDLKHSAPREIQSQEVEVLPHTFSNSFPDLASASNNEKIYDMLEEEAKFKISLPQTNDLIFQKILNGWDLWRYKDLPQRFVEYFHQNKIAKKKWFNRMALCQLNEIEQLEKRVWGLETFVKVWLKKEYLSKNHNLKEEQKYEVVKVIAVEVKSNPHCMDAIKTIVLLNVLTLEMKLGKCEEVWFMDYLQFHRNHNLYNNPKYNYEEEIIKFEELLIDDTPDEQNLLEYYINNLFTRGRNIEQFQEFVNLNFLKRIYTKVMILRGEPIESIEDEFMQSELLTSVELEPCIDNPKEFTRSELVRFSMNIKNIPRLLVKILEINTQSYFLKNNAPLTTDLKLDGLISKSEYSFEYSEPAQVRSRRDFQFPELSDKLGVFFIEFFGNGRQSRVIVKKGSLRHVSLQTSAGHFVYVMDEDNKICKENAGVYIDSRFHEANPQDGRINIPFARSTAVKSIILTDGAISELVSDFKQASENYDLRVAFVFHKEQMVAGEHASIFIKPRLLVNGVKAPDSLLGECRAVVKTTDIDSVSSTRIFTDLVIPSDSGAIEIEISVPPRLQSIEIDFLGEVESIDGKKISLKSSYSTIINSVSDQIKMTCAFLRQTPNGFLLEILGRNGEPVRRQIVEVKLKHIYWQNAIKQTLSSNEEGRVDLGKLEKIEDLSVGVVSQGSPAENYLWKIQPLRGKIEYPKKIKICEGDEYGIPANLPEETWEEEIWLHSKVKDCFIESHISQISYDTSTNMIMLRKLEAGTYRLKFKNSDVSIKILVVEGIHLDEKFIMKENSSITTNNDYMAIGIKNIQVTDSQATVDLTGNTGEGSVIYALFFNFITPELLETVSEFGKLKEDSISNEKQYNRPSNYYLSSASLDEEYQYILDRKKLHRFTGNTLAKPQILLNRLFLQDTTTEIQQSGKGENFSKENIGRSRSSSSSGKKKKMGMAASSVRKTNFFEFLKNNAIILEVPVENNRSTFSIPGSYSSLLVIAYNSKGLSYELHPLGINPQKRNLTLTNSTIDCIEICKARALFEGETLKIEDFSSTSIEIVDSVGKMFKVMRDMSNINKSQIEINEWSFLVDWPRSHYRKRRNYMISMLHMS